MATLRILRVMSRADADGGEWTFADPAANCAIEDVEVIQDVEVVGGPCQADELRVPTSAITRSTPGR